MRLVSKSVFLFLCFFTQPKAQEIIVVKTHNIPIVERILTGFQSICSDKYPLTIYDMQGNSHKGENILSQINDKVTNQTIKAVFTIGLPATQLINQSIKNIPIVFTLVSDPKKKGFLSKNIRGISKDLPADIQLQTLTKTLPQAKQIAIIYSQQYSAFKADQIADIAAKHKLKINLYQVTSVKEIPKTLRLVITENDALILLPDRLVINQSSLEYFVTTVLENGFPTLAYNQYLVKSGILMGLSPDYIRIGQQAGHLLCSKNNSRQAIHESEQFNFFVNSKTANSIRMQLTPNLLELADHVY